MKKINLDAIKNKNLSEMPEDMLKEINGGCNGVIGRIEGCYSSKATYYIHDIDRCTANCWSSEAEDKIIKDAKTMQLSRCWTHFSVSKFRNAYHVIYWN